MTSTKGDLLSPGGDQRHIPCLVNHAVPKALLGSLKGMGLSKALIQLAASLSPDLGQILSKQPRLRG